jgi:uncharacterized protein YciI
MNEAEREVMQRHAGYLAALLANGRGVAFGPVMDPAGVFGMGIIEAADEAAARAITDSDPASTIACYEIYPMRLLKKD